jgi:hypothetical protein
MPTAMLGEGMYSWGVRAGLVAGVLLLCAAPVALAQNAGAGGDVASTGSGLGQFCVAEKVFAATVLQGFSDPGSAGKVIASLHTMQAAAPPAISSDVHGLVTGLGPYFSRETKVTNSTEQNNLFTSNLHKNAVTALGNHYSINAFAVTHCLSASESALLAQARQIDAVALKASSKVGVGDQSYLPNTSQSYLSRAALAVAPASTLSVSQRSANNSVPPWLYNLKQGGAQLCILSSGKPGIVASFAVTGCP